MKTSLKELLTSFLLAITGGFIALDITTWFTPQNMTPLDWVGGSTIIYGYPLKWLKLVTMTYIWEIRKYSVFWDGFLIDLIFWSLIIGVPIAIVFKVLEARKGLLRIFFELASLLSRCLSSITSFSQAGKSWNILFYSPRLPTFHRFQLGRSSISILAIICTLLYRAYKIRR